MFANPEFLATRLVFIGLIVEALEMFWLRRRFDSSGLFSRRTLGILLSGAHLQLRVISALGGGAFVAAAMGVQAVAATVVILRGTGSRAGIVAALVCLATNALVRARTKLGGSGAEQLTFMVLVTFGLVMIAGDTVAARRIGDAFLAAQVTLAYLAAGVSKAISPTWRSGRALGAILSTEGYGLPSLGVFLVAHPIVDLALSWSVIVWETAFPLAFLAPRPVLLGTLAVGVLFHTGCAIFMGLNRFPWAFCGCYPAILTSWALLHH